MYEKTQILSERTRFTVQDEIFKRIKDLGIKVGSFITYKEEICNILGVEYSSQPHTKKKHMKDVSQFMKLEPVGKGKGLKYKVVEIYDEVQEREDKRKLNGHYDKFNEILGDNRGHNPRTIPLESLDKFYSIIHLTEFVKEEHEMSLYEFIHSRAFALIDDVDKDYLIRLSLSQIHNYCHLGNDYTSQLLLHKVDLAQGGFIEKEIIYLVMNNLYSSMRNKFLCPYAKKDKIIILSDSNSRIATKCDLDDIQNAENEAIGRFNNVYDTNYEYKDVYVKLTSKQQSFVSSIRKEILSEEIKDFYYDMTSICINKSIRSDIECLCECLGDLLEVSEKEFNEFIEQVECEVFQCFYDNEVKRINEHYDEQITNHEQQHKRSFGRGYKQRINDKRRVSLRLLDLCLQSDLTSKDIKLILHMID